MESDRLSRGSINKNLTAVLLRLAISDLNAVLQQSQGLCPKACLLSWLPGVGDPLCAVAGWLKLPFWPCLVYMAIGKFARYVTMTAVLMGVVKLW